MPENGRVYTETVARHEDASAPLLLVDRARRCRRRPAPSASTPVYVEDRLNQLQQSITAADRPDRAAAVPQPAAPAAAGEDAGGLRVPPRPDGEGRQGGGPRPAGPGRPPHACPPGPAASPPPHARRRRRRPPGRPALSRRLQAAAGRRLRRRRARLQGLPAAQSASTRWPAMRSTGWARPTTRARDYQNADGGLRRGLQDLQGEPQGAGQSPEARRHAGRARPQARRLRRVRASFNQDYPRATDLQKRRVDQERQKNGCG